MRALITDDERLARSELKRLLAAHPEIEIVGEARNGDEAVAMVRKLKPDLLFLDISMPGKTGFDVLAELEASPQVIFTTAYDHFAIRAFEVNALDYLLKPIEPERLAEAVNRALNEEVEEPEPTIEALSTEDRVFVKDGARCWFVPLSQVSIFESEGNYTRLYLHKERPLIYRSLAYLEDRLDPKHFFRAGRKHIVNLDHIVSIEPATHGGLIATLRDRLTVELSRRQAQKFKDQLTL